MILLASFVVSVIVIILELFVVVVGIILIVAGIAMVLLGGRSWRGGPWKWGPPTDA